jgi:hypothetical protein
MHELAALLGKRWWCVRRCLMACLALAMAWLGRTRLSLAESTATTACAMNWATRSARASVVATGLIVMVGLASFAGSASAAHRWSGEPFAAPTGMDFDGDGHDELIIRRPSFDPSDRTANDALGSVEIYCTQRRELLLLLNSPWPNDLFGFSAGSAGDITGDGFADIVVGAPYALRIDDSREPAAMSVNDADDAARRDGETSNAARGVLSGDESGLSNEAVEGQADAWPHGRVDVFCGATGQLVRSLQHPQMYMLGRVVTGVGDVNGDGVPDIAASGYARDAQHNAHERVIVFCGLTGDAIRVFMPERTGDGFGHTIAGLGDLDGDGFADIAIGAPNAIADPQQNTRGVIHVFRGEPMPDVAEVLLSDEPITQARHANRHAFARIAARDSLLEFGRHVLAGPMAAMRPDGSIVALDDIANENEADAEPLRTMLVLSMRFDQATQQIAWLAETIDPLTGERISHAELPRFERGGDITRDLAVSERDLEALLTMLGNSPDPNDPFNADLNDDDAVDAHDLDRVTEHFGTRHQLLNLTANAGEAMLIFIEELNARRRLSIADDQRCAQPMRTRAFPGVAVFCDDDAQWIGANPPGVMALEQSQEDGGSNPWMEWWNSVCPGCNYGECCTGCCSAPSPPPGCCGGLPAYCDHICGTGGGGDPGGGGTGGENPGGGEGGDCPGDDDCDGIPNEFDCDHPSGPGTNDPCCDNGPGPWFGGGPPPPYEPQHPQNEDDDCDGIPNWADCNSDCYIGNATTDCACQDDDQDGIPNQNTCGHECAHPDLLCIKVMVFGGNDSQSDANDSDAAELESDLLLLATHHDHDFDGIIDFTDGYNRLGAENAPQDDSLGGVEFTPLGIVIPGSCDAEATLTINYPAADPLAVEIVGAHDPGPGSLRLWTKGAASPRNPDPVRLGGDYVEPGEYSLSDFTVVFGGIKLFAESVRESMSADDLTITAVYACDSCGVNSSLHLTSVRVELQGRYWGEAAWRWTPAFIATPVYDALDPPDDAVLDDESGWFIHRLIVHDPRDVLDLIFIGGQVIPMTRNGPRWESAPFWVDAGPHFAFPVGGPGDEFLRLAIDSDIVTWQYASIDLSGGKKPKGKKAVLNKIPAEGDDVVMQHIIDEVTQELEADLNHAWKNAYHPDDTGAYGKEVHKRVGQRLQGKLDWHSSVWFDTTTRKVVSIGAPPQGGATDTIGEIDVLKMKKGQTIQVGWEYDPSKVSTVHEIKTSIRGGIAAPQRAKYEGITGGNLYRVQNPTRYYSHTSNSWVVHTRGTRLRNLQKVLVGGVVAGGVASLTILTVAIPANREAAYEHLANTFEANGWLLTDPWEGPIAAAAIAHALGSIADESTGAIAAYSAAILYHYQPE